MPFLYLTLSKKATLKGCFEKTLFIINYYTERRKLE